MRNVKEYVFGLDIGTRSIVGTVGYQERSDYFRVVAQVTIKHETRAVIDGQIHDIPAVTGMINKIKEQLESMIGEPLRDVCIAAAGRVLITKKVRVTHNFEEETTITDEHINMVDMLGIESAYDMMRKDEAQGVKQFYCVGFTTVQYYLNDYAMAKVEMHKANSIGVELIATFLPDEVVSGLYIAVEGAGLSVTNLTLEPIAAINVAIPEKFRLLNIALVDIGAGTSDMSIVKDGSIIAFGMLPLAGDEITEAIAREYLIDFQTAEEVKLQISEEKTISIENIMGECYTLTPDEILEVIDDTVSDIAKKITAKVTELNGEKKVSAMFIIGGGGKLPGFIGKLAQYTDLPPNRVSLRGEDVLKKVTFIQDDIVKDSTLVTPIGICLNFYEQSNNFIHVTVNSEHIKMYNNNTLTVLDAALQVGFTQGDLFPSRGNGFRYVLNGQERDVKGTFGEPAEIRLNGKNVSLNANLNDKDDIYLKKAIAGDDGTLRLGELREYKKSIHFVVFGKNKACPQIVLVNGEEVSSEYQIKEGDQIEIFDFYTLRQAAEYFGWDISDRLLINGKSGNPSMKLYNGDVIEETEILEETKNEKIDREENEKEKSEMPENTDKEGIKEKDNTNTQEVNNSEDEVSEDNSLDEPKSNVITIIVNGTEVTLEDKPNHIFVEVFDVYPFDLSKAMGKRLVSRVNGISVDFTYPISQGDSLELVWED
ncbi:MAG: pilus assembly protein PilM [Lachnoclostridium sp.]|nr:pilus assembly protein PilM [Lachnoclostridium sp.]